MNFEHFLLLSYLWHCSALAVFPEAACKTGSEVVSPPPHQPMGTLVDSCGTGIHSTTHGAPLRMVMAAIGLYEPGASRGLVPILTKPRNEQSGSWDNLMEIMWSARGKGRIWAQVPLVLLSRVVFLLRGITGGILFSADFLGASLCSKSFTEVNPFTLLLHILCYRYTKFRFYQRSEMLRDWHRIVQHVAELGFEPSRSRVPARGGKSMMLLLFPAAAACGHQVI